MKIKFTKVIEDAIAPVEVQDGVYMLYAAQDPRLIQPVDGSITALITSGHVMEIEGKAIAMLTPMNDLTNKTLNGSISFINGGEVATSFTLTNNNLPPVLYKKSEPFALLILIDPVKAETSIIDPKDNSDKNEVVQQDDKVLPSEGSEETVEEVTNTNITL